MTAQGADVVVVGAGSGGCVLTRRLLDAGLRVLLVEAGGHDRHLFIRAPGAFPKTFRSRFDWNFQTAPQPHASGRSFYWPRGKVLGGSSAINASIYIRGSRADYDGWGAGWTWAEVLPALRGLETYRGPAGETRGDRGPLPVGARAASHALSEAFVQSAARALGVPGAASFNDGEHLGAALLESNHRRGERYSAFRAFLQPVLRHPNLTVLTGAHVLQLLWDGPAGEGQRAAGVRLRWRGRTLDVPAGGVVLAAGTVQTPQLLMLSGLGRAAELRRHGLPVRSDLRGMGANLQDHLAVPTIFRSSVPSLDRVPLAQALARYLWNRSGPLSSNVAEAAAFSRLRPEADPAGGPSRDTFPDLQYHFGPAYFRDHGFKTAPGHHFSVGPVLVHPYSRGRVTLASADPTAAPVIDPGYLSDERDVQRLVAGVRQAREIAAASPLGELNRGEVLPGGEVQSAAALAQYVQRECATLYHPVGTAALGDGEGAVVDRRLAVRGTRGLWVADASVMPTIIHANTNATAMMIGARAAEFVQQEL